MKLTELQKSIVDEIETRAAEAAQEAYDNTIAAKIQFLGGIWTTGETPKKKWKYEDGELIAVD